GDDGSPVRIACEVTTEDFELPDIPDVAVRVGLDRDPIDVDDAGDARWLLACVWPDTGRLERTAGALRLAVEARPHVRRGAMVDDLDATLDGQGGDGLAVVLTSVAYSYLDRESRQRFVDHLAGAAVRRPVIWLSFEPPGVVDRFPTPAVPETGVQPVV